MIYKVYEPNSVLNVHKHVDGGWFWDKYSAFPYVGCFYGCEYCYWRDEKYNRLAREPEAAGLDDPFRQYIKIKKNAPELLRKSLATRSKEIIYIDSYQPIEAKHHLVREMLEVCADLDFPVFINEKSPLLLKDLEVLRRISRRSYLNIGWSMIYSVDDGAKGIFESRTPSIASRFRAMKKLSNHGMTVGTVFMPVLPLISDTEDNIKAVVKKTKDAGGVYVLDGGLTLRGYCAAHFYRFLKKYDGSLVPEYKRLYSKKEALGKRMARAHALVREYCERYGLDNYINRPVSFYPEEIQVNKKVAERFYLESRELLMTKGMGYKQFALLKAAWIIDSLTENIRELYEKKGKSGLLELVGVGEKTSDEIITVLEELDSD